ncbi:winged helix-turn-helix domain-containing protein [Natronosalvus halobius]|uniref:winged helix-turn-helix domain-containing protein n=1 Tax=Natronosalvus halobius TaxID=2953746 RepID=UPI00209E1C8C|nr:winged helix-turn-helix domain-containing protein [Natronosalvus halobius]USZ73366.1 winged helix-turn-helix domain-containing protein [Natronosalvus halobius]
MRKSGTWMTIWDDRILEIIQQEGPTPVGKLTESDEVRISQSSVSRRCQKLAEKDLLLPIGNGVYSITETGEAYLDEEYDAENEVFLNGNGNGSENGPTASEASKS